MSQRTPDSSVIWQLYDAGGALKAVQLQHRGETDATSGAPLWAAPVSNITYNARGQRQRVVYGNDTATRYSYDPEGFGVRYVQFTISGRRSRLSQRPGVSEQAHFTLSRIGRRARCLCRRLALHLQPAGSSSK